MLLVLTMMMLLLLLPLAGCLFFLFCFLRSAWFGASIWVSFIAGVVLMKAVDM